MRIKRITTNKEWSLLQRLNAILFKGCEPYTKHPNGAYWLVWCGDKAVGFFGVNKIDDLENTAFFSRAGFLKQYTQKGLHRRSLQVRRKYCKQNGLTHLVSYTHKYNLRSANNLEAFGFRIYTPIDARGIDKDMYYFHMFL